MLNKKFTHILDMLRKKLAFILDMPRKNQILILVVALTVLFSIIGISVPIANKNKDDIVMETQIDETLVDETAAETQSTEAVNEDELQYSEDGVYLIVNEYVCAEGDVWLHSAPGTNSEKIVVLDSGDVVNRVGVGSNGWSQILHNGTIGYVATYWVTPLDPPKYDEVKEFVRLTESANLREDSNINSRKVATLDRDFEMVRIAIGRNGWSKVIYNGRVRYMYSAYITPIDREVTEADLVLKD